MKMCCYQRSLVDVYFAPWSGVGYLDAIAQAIHNNDYAAISISYGVDEDLRTTKLRLKVNETKSAVARPEERKFLGFSISNEGGERRIAPKRPSTHSRRGFGSTPAGHEGSVWHRLSRN